MRWENEMYYMFYACIRVCEQWGPGICFKVEFPDCRRVPRKTETLRGRRKIKFPAFLLIINGLMCNLSVTRSLVIEKIQNSPFSEKIKVGSFIL